MDFEHLQTVCLPIGFSGTANQPLAYALTAHPNVVMGNEFRSLKNWWNNGTPLAVDEFLSEILTMNDKMGTNEITYKRKKARYYLVADQWQGRYERLAVIGDCSPRSNTEILITKKCKALEIFADNIQVPIKFIFLVRNPYDMISSSTITSYWQKTRTEILNIMIDKFIKGCEQKARLLAKISQMPVASVLVWYLEDHIANPQKKLAELCDFLNIESSESYLDACAKIFYKKPSKSRYLINWPEEYKARVAATIEQYDFLSDYSWDS